MSRTDRRFAALARLQRLAELERRREAEAACVQTDRCAVEAGELGVRMAHAEQEQAAAHADPRLCLSRLAIAGAIITASEGALRRGRAALAAAQAGEAAACGAWLQSRFRTQWLVDRDRDERRRDGARRADRADADARLLRVGREPEA